MSPKRSSRRKADPPPEPAIPRPAAIGNVWGPLRRRIIRAARPVAELMAAMVSSASMEKNSKSEIRMTNQIRMTQ